jgi:PAS domain-containing protein
MASGHCAAQPRRTTDAERRLGELLESAPDAILELDEEGRIVLLNRMSSRCLVTAVKS